MQGLLKTAGQGEESFWDRHGDKVLYGGAILGAGAGLGALAHNSMKNEAVHNAKRKRNISDLEADTKALEQNTSKRTDPRRLSTPEGFDQFMASDETFIL